MINFGLKNTWSRTKNLNFSEKFRTTNEFSTAVFWTENIIFVKKAHFWVEISFCGFLRFIRALFWRTIVYFGQKNIDFGQKYMFFCRKNMISDGDFQSKILDCEKIVFQENARFWTKCSQTILQVFGFGRKWPKNIFK